eukprot:5194619-Pleurochrysis_carterae.AAC.4
MQAAIQMRTRLRLMVRLKASMKLSVQGRTWPDVQMRSRLILCTCAWVLWTESIDLLGIQKTRILKSRKIVCVGVPECTNSEGVSHPILWQGNPSKNRYGGKKAKATNRAFKTDRGGRGEVQGFRASMSDTTAFVAKRTFEPCASSLLCMLDGLSRREFPGAVPHSRRIKSKSSMSRGCWALPLQRWFMTISSAA